MVNCIICGQELKEVACEGSMMGMKVTFCGDHVEYCDNCERVNCGKIES